MAQRLEQLPVFQPQKGDVKALNDSVHIIDMSETPGYNPALSLAGHLEDFIYSVNIPGGNTNLHGYKERLSNGGTLVAREVVDLALNVKSVGDDVTALKARLGHGLESPVSLKAYIGKKNGLGPHRDGNFENSGEPMVIDAIGLIGVREFGLWVVPQAVVLEGNDATFMRNVTREKAIVGFQGRLDGRDTIFRPVRTATFGPAQGVRIDEKTGVWQRPNNGHSMAVWHSVFAIHEDDKPVITAVVRSSHPRQLPHTAAAR